MDFTQLFLIFNIGFVASILNILHVIIGYARTLPGQTYLATGHYYLDYFEYLQALSQGWFGHWFYQNYYGTEIKFKTLTGMWQYLIFGHIGKLFGLSQIATYWTTMVILSVALSVLIFYVIKKLLHDKPFYWQLAAYILALFAAPFFMVIHANGHLTTLAYRFWNDKAVLVDRFDGIPYHVTDQIITLIVLLVTADSLEKMKSLTKTSLIARSAAIIGLMTFVISYSPAYFILMVGSLGLTLACLFFSKKSFAKVRFLSIILIILLPIAVFFRNYFNHLYIGVAQIESAWQVHPNIFFVLGTTGPILLFSWLGIRQYFQKLTDLRLAFFNLVLVSYVMFFSPVALYLGTTNTRFLIPLNYIFFAVLTVIGLKKLKTLVIITGLVFLLFIPGNIESIIGQTANTNLVSPISYLPSDIITGFKFIKKYPGQGVVLTTPAQFLGAIIPTYADKPVYLERPGQLKYDEKVYFSAHFYLGLMDDRSAKEFLKQNHIEFIVLTSIDGYPLDLLSKYPFVKEIYRNKDIVIFRSI